MSQPSAPGGDADRPAPRRQLPERPSLEQLRKQAKELLRDARPSALARMATVGRSAGSNRAALSDAPLAIAREFGFPGWPKLVRHAQALTRRTAATRSSPICCARDCRDGSRSRPEPRRSSQRLHEATAAPSKPNLRATRRLLAPAMKRGTQHFITLPGTGTCTS